MLFLYFIVYQVLQVTAFPLVILYLFKRKLQKKSMVANLAHRLGFVPRAQAPDKKVIWIHAVSVGEVLATESLIDQIRKDTHNYVYLTTGTPSAYNLAKKQIPADKISYLPFDFLLPMLIAFRRIKPSTLIVIEAEVWPNLLMLSRFFKLHMYSLNARIPLKSQRRYFIFKYLYRVAFNLYDHIYAQTEDNKKLFLKMGITREKVSALGNIKAFNVLKKLEQKNMFDVARHISFKEFDAATPEKKTHVLLAGSIHPGEIDYYITLYTTMKKQGHNVKLIVAPRHFHWQEALENKVIALGDPYAVWDEKSIRITRNPDVLPKAETTIQKKEVENPAQLVLHLLQNADIVVVCVMGKLFDIYQLADIFFLGGTFVTVGGHNLLEPCVWRKPSIVGPHYENCYDCADALEEGNALIKVKDEADLCATVDKLLSNPASIQSMGANAYHWLSSEAREVKKNLDHLIHELSCR